MRETFIEIDSQRLYHNWQVFKQKIKPDTQILANLKANAYGIGAYEVGRLLEQWGVSYFSVAYINEGIALRQKGIQTNLLVFNPSFQQFEALIKYRLEPEVSSLRYLKILLNFLQTKQIKNFPVHIKLDTGMHRAGVMPTELSELSLLLQNSHIKVKSVFSHLAAAEDESEDAFTRAQIGLFEQMSQTITKMLPYTFFKHLLNTAGVFRFPEAQYDMIRPGLGLFGYHLNENYQKDLQPIMQLKTKINQVKNLSAGDTVGYSRKYKAKANVRVGLLPLGYADGINRHLGQGHYTVKCKRHEVPVIGVISMDTMSIDLTGTGCQAGDEVVVIDNQQDVYQIAKKLNTISYEIIAGLSHRLVRKVI